MKNIALLTDFGLRDWYVGVVKSVIIENAKEPVNFIDLSHEVSPQNIQEASFILWNAFKYLPKNTVTICVVDPEVGAERRIIGLRTKDQVIIYPDNGILDLLINELDIEESILVDIGKLDLKTISTIFHGRDVFAPLAARLLNSESLSTFGEPVKLDNQRSNFAQVNKAGKYEGKIFYIDRFGNCITSFMVDPDLSSSDVSVELKELQIKGITKNYASIDDKYGLIIGSAGLLEISTKSASAAERLEVSVGESVSLIVNS